MRFARLALIAAFSCAGWAPAFAVEGSTAAGPIGGTDIRSAQLPPPGLYGGNILGWATAYDFVDGEGNTIPALSDAQLSKKLTAPFLVYVPDFKVLGGSVAIAGIVPMGEECGHLFAGTPDDCFPGIGDPYVELVWSRSFGEARPSRFSGALPIFEGLSVLLGFGVVLPWGRYDAEVVRTQGTTMGNNIYDFAPTVALTYTTAPILAEGTEVSAKLYWNNYLENPATHYSTGDLLGLDFAISERIGRFQIGVAGVYFVQVEDDRLFGVSIPPDGRRAEVVNLGGLVNVDVPELSGSFKLKSFSTIMAENSVWSHGIVFGWVKKSECVLSSIGSSALRSDNSPTSGQIQFTPSAKGLSHQYVHQPKLLLTCGSSSRGDDRGPEPHIFHFAQGLFKGRRGSLRLRARYQSLAGYAPAHGGALPQPDLHHRRNRFRNWTL